MATAVSISYSVGDTVFVWYDLQLSSGLLPASRTVSRIDIGAAADVATIYFSDGVAIQTSTASPRVYTTQAACATAILNQIITISTALVALESSPTAVVGTSGTATALRRWKA